MGDYFKPWRRKIGVATLVMACVFAAGWVRGNSYWDFITIIFHVGNNVNCHQLHSSRQGLTWGNVEHFIDPIEFGTFSFHIRHDTERIDQLILTHMETMDGPERIDWRWKWGGFDFGKWESGGDMVVSYWSVPYWFIVIPLTLLSAWLLLSKPRPAKPIKPTTA